MLNEAVEREEVNGRRMHVLLFWSQMIDIVTKCCNCLLYFDIRGWWCVREGKVELSL